MLHMCTSHINYWSSAGLIFDIIGVIFLFFYDLPSRWDNGDQFTDYKKPNEQKNKRIKILSCTGLILIGIGFILQFIGTNWG